MSDIAMKHFSTVEYIQKLRKAEFTEAQAEVVAEIIELQAQNISDYNNRLTQFENKDLATKGDISLVRSEVRESELRLQNSLKSLEIKLMALYGAGFLVLLGILAKGFHWF